MLSIRLPVWVYWMLAALAVAGAAAFSIYYDFSQLDPSVARRLALTVWGGPVTLVLAAALATALARRSS